MIKNFAANLKIGAVMGSSVGRVFQGVNKRIKGQESELKRLRAAYKEASKGTGEYAGKLDQLQREIAKTEAGLKRLRAISKFNFGASLKGIGSKFAGDATRLGVVGGVVGAAGLAIGKNMLDTTAAFEKSLTILKTVEGSAEKAGQSFSWIQDFAQKTPFELQQVTDAFVRLRAYGIDPIRGDSLRVLGDTSSAMGKDVMDAVEAIADAVTGENERLKEFGIKASKEGGKIAYTFTDRNGKQMRKVVNANNRAMIQSTILAIWNSKYKGAMKEQSKTWNGMVSNLKDSWARFAYMVMQSGPFEGLKNELDGLLKQMDVWAKDGTMKKWAEQTGKFMVKAGGEAKKFGIQIFEAADAVQKFLGGWDNLGIALIGLNFAPTIAALYSLGAAATAALGPWGLLAAAIVGVGTALYTNSDAITEALGASWKDEPAQPNYELPKTPFNDLFGVTSGGYKTTPIGSNIPAKSINRDPFTGQVIEEKGGIKTDTVKELRDYFKKISKNTDLPEVPDISNRPVTAEELGRMIDARPVQNNFNINVTAPGGDGRRIADSIRSEFNRKPLYDMDSFMSPATP